jgi:hypothetical protein
VKLADMGLLATRIPEPAGGLAGVLWKPRRRCIDHRVAIRRIRINSELVEELKAGTPRSDP